MMLQHLSALQVQSPALYSGFSVSKQSILLPNYYKDLLCLLYQHLPIIIHLTLQSSVFNGLSRQCLLYPHLPIIIHLTLQSSVFNGLSSVCFIPIYPLSSILLYHHRSLMDYQVFALSPFTHYHPSYSTIIRL